MHSHQGPHTTNSVVVWDLSIALHKQCIGMHKEVLGMVGKVVMVRERGRGQGGTFILVRLIRA